MLVADADPDEVAVAESVACADEDAVEVAVAELEAVVVAVDDGVAVFVAKTVPVIARVAAAVAVLVDVPVGVAKRDCAVSEGTALTVARGLVLEASDARGVDVTGGDGVG